MKSKTLLQSLVAFLAAFILGSVPSSAWAQTINPVRPVLGGAIPSHLHRCTAEVLNVSGFVGTDGVVNVFNVPTAQGQVRVQVTCLDASNSTVTCVSDRFTPIGGFAANMGAITCGAGLSIPTTLALSFSSASSVTTGQVTIGQTRPLTALATISGAPAAVDVTAGSTGTSYRSSNTNVATISADGVVTGVSTGTALIYALHEGTGGFASVTVLPAAVESIEITPKPTNGIVIDLPKIFQSVPVQLKVTATLGDAGHTKLDLTSTSAGTQYVSSNPAVALVTANGLVIPQAPGGTTITVSEPSSGAYDTVDVTVTQFLPATKSAYAAAPGGYAYNADIAGTLVYVAEGGTGLRVIDVAAGALVGTRTFTGASAYDVRVNGNLAAVALGTAGVALVNIKDNIMTEYYRLTPGGDVRDVWLSGTTLYCANGSAFFAYDVSNPAAWTASPPATITVPVANARAVSGDASRDLAVVVSGTSPPVLTVIQSGSAVGSVALPDPGFSGSGEDVVLFGTSAYVARGRSGIQRVDLTDVAHPVVKGQSEPLNPTDAHGVAVRSTPKGVLVAIGDDLYYNSVPLLNAQLTNFYDIEICNAGGCNVPVIQSDANGTGIALGDGFGVETVGGSGIQVFRTAPLVDNAGVAPQVWIKNPAKGSSSPLNRAVRVTIGAVDDVEVAAVQVFVNGNPITTKPTAPYTAFYVPSQEGPISITARATDLGGNTATSEAVVLTIVAPIVGAIDNFGFETGDLTDWNLVGGGQEGSQVRVVTDDVGLEQNSPPTHPPFLARYGARFLAVQAGCPGSPYGVSRDLVLTAGQVISGYAALLGDDYFPYDDFAVVLLTPGGEVWRQSIFSAGAADYSDSQDWEEWSFTAPADGLYTIAFESENALDCGLPSWALFDAPDVF